MKKTFAYGIVALAAIALTACGGGSDGDDKGGIAPETYISGTFYDARITGDTYSTDNQGLGAFGDQCVDQHHYFEDANQRIRVYGSSGFSESTFREMATHIDNNLDSVMSLFNTTWSSFVTQRQILTLSSMEEMLVYQLENDGSVKPPLADNFDAHTISDPEQTYAAWLTMTPEERVASIEAIIAMLDQSKANGAYIDDAQYPSLQERDFVVACLHPTMGGNTSGEGTIPGIVLTANPSSYDGNFGRLVKHELVHFVQGNLTRVGSLRRSLPRWFEEGQAVVFSGMSYHSPSAHYGYDPVEIVNSVLEVGSPGEAYKHYGLAYNYLDKANGKDGMADFLWAIRLSTENPLNYSLPEGEHVPRFIEAFDSTLVDHNGNPLPFLDYKNNYHDIMNTQ